MTESVSTIEHDIVDLEHKLEEKKAALEREKSSSIGGGGLIGETHPSEKELLREVVGEKIQQHISAFQTQQPSGQGQTPIATEPPSYLSQELKDKIREIVQLVFSKNLDEGIKEAVKTGNIAMIDAFHDILTDELYNELIESRKIDRVE